MMEGDDADLLSQWASTRDRDERTSIIWDLAKRAEVSAAARAALARIAREDKSPDNRREALEGLYGREVSPELVATLQQVLENERSTEVRGAAAYAISNAPLEQLPQLYPTIPSLVRAYRRSRGDVREWADDALRMMTGAFANEMTPAHLDRLEAGEHPDLVFPPKGAAAPTRRIPTSVIVLGALILFYLLLR
jgi:hypothetical protein